MDKRWENDGKPLSNEQKEALREYMKGLDDQCAELLELQKKLLELGEEHCEVAICFALARVFRKRPNDVLNLMVDELSKDLEAGVYDEDIKEVDGKKGRQIVEMNRDRLVQMVKDLADHLTMGL